MEDVGASDSAFLTLAQKLEKQLRHHANDEESKQFPQLRAHIPAQGLVELGEKVETAKKLAPTRPHPNAPHSELFHKSIGPGIGMVDRLLNQLTGRMTG
ncbi:hypothetical protein [Salinicola corii]|uniref:hypothetical protein n=1 Tax=Salinicola corii TaxID=2606937 RepID=UPI001EF0B552|nr:hypothetical protein [Salinicola corii]